ncbi:hypothetical protein [Lederbergia panacisoli]|uniref:hypothetical protein n=1 Tax=Lederbergia panacisoli TaxID=1255251 RepID=UPI00214AFD0E|nr:hypothetical protein [Lederbergia panacisoli]MCR2820505.1 hypothetical protein [Lederbergia panacisoli]
MDEKNLIGYFESTTPGDEQKLRMRKAILSQTHEKVTDSKKKWRWDWAKITAASVICVALAFLFSINNPFNGEAFAYAINIIDPDGTRIQLADNENTREDFGISVSNVNSRPDLEFYIDGEDIEKIEITTSNEYIYAVDWTETQHRKYWDVEYYQYFDEEKQIAVADFDLIYDKQLTMTFDENFSDYDKIWFRWVAWDLYQWAAADDYAHFLGEGIKIDDLSDEEKTRIATGGTGLGIGHIQLDGYPENLREDTITITITNRDGKEITKVIGVKVSNNELRQTVVTATLLDN